MRTARIFGACLLGFCLFAASPVFAADPTPEDMAQARSLGEQGQAALDAKRFAEAEKLFSAASKLYPVAPTLALGVARAQAAQGKLIAARETYNRIVRDADKAPATSSPVFKAALESARSEGDALSPRIANVTITIDGPKEPHVIVDDAPVPAAALGLPRPVDPGTHKIQVTAEGYKPAEQSFTVDEGKTTEQKLTLVKDPAATSAVTPPPVTPPPTPPPQSPPPPEEQKSSRKAIGYVVGGVGAAGVIVGGIAGIVAIGQHSDIKTDCGGSSSCPFSEKSKVDGYNTTGLVSTIAFIAGGVGLGVGAALILTAPKPEKAAFVSPYIGPGSLGLTGRF